MKRAAFSLVELSIVLVILGLLTGGILVGKSLIRASELRAITSEQARYFTATKAFRDKYFAVPGDMSNATAFWGKDAVNCNGNSGNAATPGTCNGNGDGLITPGPTGGTGESYQFWNQLAQAGLIEGTYTGIAGATNNVDSTPGVNVPASKFTNGGWYAWNWSTIGDSSTNSYQGVPYGEAIHIGKANSGTWLNGALLTPEEAWNIDSKLDDGEPATGRVIARFWNNLCAAADSGGSTNTNLVASYRLSDSTVRCTLYFTQAF